MENIFSIFTYFEEDENIQEGDKAIYVSHKGKIICFQLFKEIKNINKLLEDIHRKLLKEAPNLKFEDKLNYLYFKWLEEVSKKEKKMEKEFTIVKRNIHVSRAISNLKGKSYEYDNFLEIFSHKYGHENVKAALKELYTFNSEIKDIKGLTAALVLKNYNLKKSYQRPLYL